MWLKTMWLKTKGSTSPSTLFLWCEPTPSAQNVNSSVSSTGCMFFSLRAKSSCMVWS